MVRAIGVDGASGNSSNVLDCQKLMQQAVQKVRAGNGPYFLEFSTYRWREHCGHSFDDHLGYRSKEEFQDWQEKDPLKHLESNLLKAGSNFSQKLAAIKSEVNLEIRLAFEFAISSPFPLQSEAYEGVFASEESI